MKSLRAFLLGLVVISLYAPLARAQGYYESDGGFYWGVRGGLSQVRQDVTWAWGAIDPIYDTATPPNLLWPGINSHIEYRSLEMNYGYVAGASVGYTALYPDSSANLRFELEGMYRRNEDGQIGSQWTPTSSNDDSISLGYETVPVTGVLEVRSAMFNVLMDMHTPTRLTPYFGVGAGISQLVAQGYVEDFNRLTYDIVACGPACPIILPYPYVFDETIYALSWQAIVGVGYHVSAGTMLTFEFRHFELAADRWSELFQTDELRNVKFDDWSMGLRLTF